MFFRKASALLAALLFISASGNTLLFSQNGTVNLIKGTVMDDMTGKPVSADLIFINSKGKKIPAKSNSSDGSYQAVLQAGEDYTIIAKNYIVPLNQNSVELSNVTKYNEVTRDLRLKKIIPGMDLFEFNAFNPNDSALILTRAYPFESLKDFLANNIKVNVQIAVSTRDSYFKPAKRTIKVMDKKKKLKTKTETITSEEQLKTLADARVNAIKDYLYTIRVPDRSIAFRQDIVNGKSAPAAPAPKKKGKKDAKTVTNPALSSLTTVKITVSKIINLD